MVHTIFTEPDGQQTLPTTDILFLMNWVIASAVLQLALHSQPSVVQDLLRS